jgi:phytoene synthase
MDAFEHCEALVREGDKDRYLAALFAPQKHRRALAALYAFNLEVARTRELAREPMPGELRLQWWRDALSGPAQGEGHPVAAALRDVVVRFRLPPQALADLIDARAFDLYNDPMVDLAELERYSVATSSALIELAARILMDGRDPQVSEIAGHAGIAYSIAGLLRALPVHASRGQTYLPADVMERQRAGAADLHAGRDTTELRAACAELRLRARQHLTAARRLLPSVPEAAMPALLPAALVHPVLARMERRSYRPFQPRDVPQWRRQWALWRAARSNLRTAF